MEDEFNLVFNEKDANFMEDISYNTIIYKINNKFLMLRNILDKEMNINIYELSNSSLLYSLKNDSSTSFFDFHSKFETIFFVCNKNVIIYQIDEKQKTVEQISIIKGHFSSIKYANFSPLTPNILMTVSKNDDIKIFDVYKSLAKNHIFINESLDLNKEIKWNNCKIAVKLKDNSIIEISYFSHNINDVSEKIKFADKIKNFYYYDNTMSFSALIVITNKNVYYGNNKNDMKSIITLQHSFHGICYFQKSKILILFDKKEILLLFLFFTKIEKTFTIKVKEIQIDYPIYFINEEQLLNNEICKFYSLNIDKINSYLIKGQNLENINDNQLKDNPNDNQLKEFLNKIISNISDLSLLLSKINNEQIKVISNKKYFDYKEIKKELEIIKTRNLFKRKEHVKKNIDKIDKKTNINEKYIFILTLLVNDNTNIDLIMKYLQFLKELENDEKKLENLKKYLNNDIEEYKNELDYYINIIPKNIYQNLNEENKISQKDNIINFFEEFKNWEINNINDFEKYLKDSIYINKKIIHYNMPTSFENEEYFIYGYYLVISNILKNLYQNTKAQSIVKEENEIANEVLKIVDILKYNMGRTLTYIKNNELELEILQYLFILTIQGLDKTEYDFSFNIITSKKIKVEDIDKFNESSEEKIILEKDKIIWKNKNYKNYENLCLNNFKLYQGNSYYSKKLYNYEYYKKHFTQKYQLSAIKEFYKNILPSKCFKSIYTNLYGEDQYYPFEDKNFIDEFFDNYYNIIPMKLENICGVTDKYSLKTFLVPFLNTYNGHIKNDKKILRKGYSISVGNHEFGHIFGLINFYMNNARFQIETPRKKALEFSEGGYYIELLLYGRKLDSLNVLEALYIINEANYNKTFLEFQNGFNDIKIEDLKVTGTLANELPTIEFNENNIRKLRNTYISYKDLENAKQKIIKIKMKNDVLGRIIPDRIYEIINKKYS